MKNLIISAIFFSLIGTLAVPSFASAHPGNTDSFGGHTCRTNCPSWGYSYGEYHFHDSSSPSCTLDELNSIWERRGLADILLKQRNLRDEIEELSEKMFEASDDDYYLVMQLKSEVDLKFFLHSLLLDEASNVRDWAEGECRALGIDSAFQRIYEKTILELEMSELEEKKRSERMKLELELLELEKKELDTTSPTLPSAMKAYSDINKTKELNRKVTNTDESPHFEWSGAYDASGIKGYYVYFGQDEDVAIFTNGTFIQSSKYTPNNITSAGDYFLVVATQDNAGNLSDNKIIYTYRYSKPIIKSSPDSSDGYGNIPEGALIRAYGDLDVYIVKYIGVKKFKRLILSPSVFNNYGHLRWEDVMDVSQSVVDAFETSELVRAVGDERVYKLYPQGDTGQKRWVKTSEAFTRNGWDTDAIYEINAFDRDSYVTGLSLE